MLILPSLKSVAFHELIIFPPGIGIISGGKITVFIGIISSGRTAVISSDPLRARVCCHTVED